MSSRKLAVKVNVTMIDTVADLVDISTTLG
jgi:hypothetical protein